MLDPQEYPRFAGVPTFMRVPYEEDPSTIDADVTFLGVPWDSDTGYRSGTRFGPRAIRNASSILKPYNPVIDVNIQEYDLVDNGDVLAIPGESDATYENIREHVTHLLDQGTLPAIAGGDHGLTMSALEAVADEFGPVSLVHFDAHSDLWTEYFGYDHPTGTWCHHAVEENWIRPETSIRIADRGGLYQREDLDMYEESGIDYYSMEEVHDLGTERIADILSETVEGPTYVTIDIDSIDPSYAPGVSAPSPDGLTPHQIFTFIRQLADVNVVGFDHVEVCPPYDNQGEITAVLGARIMSEAIAASLA